MLLADSNIWLALALSKHIFHRSVRGWLARRPARDPLAFCRFTQLTTGTWSLKLPASLVHVDVDPAELGRHYPVTLGLACDALTACAPSP